MPLYVVRIGGLWTIEAEARAAVEALVEQDPFWQRCLGGSREIWRYATGFPDRKVPV